MSDVQESVVPTVKFPQRERRGVFLGRTTAQLVVIGATIGVILISALLFRWAVAGWLTIPGIPVMLFAGWTYRGEPLLTLAAQSAGFTRRGWTGQNSFQRSIGAPDRRTALPMGVPLHEAAAPIALSTLRLPGGVGDVQFIDIPGRGGFVYNVREKLAAVTVKVNAPAWMLRDDNDKAQTHRGFGGWLSSTEGMRGLVEAELRVRVDRAPSTELSEYAARRDEERTTEISEELRGDYDWLAAVEQARSMEFTSTITLVFDAVELRESIKDSGGGISGLAAILSDRVEGLEGALSSIGVELDSWMTARELDSYVNMALDPVTASDRRQRLGRSAQEGVSRPPIMSIDAHRSSLTVNESEHRVLWIDEWPRTNVSVGFLHPLLYTGEATRCLVLTFTPRSRHEALNDVLNARSDLSAANSVREKLGTATTLFQDREEADVAQREKDLVDGYTDSRFRAYVTISAPSLAEVGRDQTSLEAAGYQSTVRLAVLYNQQWAAFVTAALPIPTRKK